eukprot:1728828-Amphidinium_carterae.3
MQNNRTWQAPAGVAARSVASDRSSLGNPQKAPTSRLEWCDQAAGCPGTIDPRVHPTLALSVQQR